MSFFASSWAFCGFIYAFIQQTVIQFLLSVSLLRAEATMVGKKGVCLLLGCLRSGGVHVRARV